MKTIAIWILGLAWLTLGVSVRPAAAEHCDVTLPDGTHFEAGAGKTTSVRYQMDTIQWNAHVNCNQERTRWQILDGHPDYPDWARTLAITTQDQSTRFLIFTNNPDLKADPFYTNGSQIRIQIPDWGYYVARLAGEAGNRAASVNYFWLGETGNNLAKLHCYNQTINQDHRIMPTFAAMWTEPNPGMLRILCSGHDFIMEAELILRPEWFERVIPSEPLPTPMPDFPKF